jgi:hypothetical protein
MLVSLTVVSCALSTPAGADPYWIAYEGNDLPENEGWTRYWGNQDGEYQGSGAVRTIEGGVLTMDSSHDPWLYDFVQVRRIGETDPGPGERFVMEWRLRVESADGYVGDPPITIKSDHGRIAGFVYQTDEIWAFYEGDTTIPITPGILHDYRFVSNDM